MLFFQVPAMFWALFNSWHNFWFVTALSSPNENTVLPPFHILEAMVSPALSATVVGYHCHRSCISEHLLVLPEVHLLWMLPSPPSRTRQKTWSQQVWRTRLISPHQRICWAVTRRICKKSQNVEETGYSEINNKKQTLTQYQRFVTLHSLYIWFIFLGIVNLLLTFFWWNASIDNTFSSTWHSLAFPLLLTGLLRFCWHTLLSHLKMHLGFQSSGTATIFLAWWERERDKDLENCLNLLSFEIVMPLLAL